LFKLMVSLSLASREMAAIIRDEFLSKTNLYCLLTSESHKQAVANSTDDAFTAGYFMTVNVVAAYEVKKEHYPESLVSLMV
jgi:hypothetical protein